MGVVYIAVIESQHGWGRCIMSITALNQGPKFRRIIKSNLKCPAEPVDGACSAGIASQVLYVLIVKNFSLVGNPDSGGHDRMIKCPRKSLCHAVTRRNGCIRHSGHPDVGKADVFRVKVEQIDELKIRLQGDEDFDRNAAYDELDALQEQLNEEYEAILDELLPEAFAVVKSTCERLVGKSWTVAGNKITWEMIPYDVQLIGGVVLHQGKIAEMATGEGKTLVATLPIYLNALTGRGVHLVTVNDYLAQRDSEWMGEIFKFHGMTIGCILNTMSPEQRKEIYKCDITYGTNNEFGFDYLRDNMAIDKEGQVQRGHNYVIVDEVDSVLVD